MQPRDLGRTRVRRYQDSFRTYHATGQDRVASWQAWENFWAYIFTVLTDNVDVIEVLPQADTAYGHSHMTSGSDDGQPDAA
jgi:hypothetical protein